MGYENGVTHGSTTAMRPPGFSTRTLSSKKRAGSDRWCNTSRASTASNAPETNGSRCASADTAFHGAGTTSTDTSRREPPRACANGARKPGPAPTSSARPPAGTRPLGQQPLEPRRVDVLQQRLLLPERAMLGEPFQAHARLTRSGG